MNNILNWDYSQNSKTSINTNLRSTTVKLIDNEPKKIKIEQATKNIISDDNKNIIKVKRQILYIKK